jgi:geranylgeranyl diphosphate synthase type I
MANIVTDSDFALRELKSFKRKFDIVVKKLLDYEIRKAKKINLELENMLNVGADFIIDGGKRLRPAFVYFGYKAVKKIINERDILKVSIPIELVHASALIHDDVMDNSAIRRGKPAVHKIFANRLKDGKKGESLAIVLGDMLLALADEILDISAKKAKKVFDEARKEINFGQHLDIVGDSLSTVDDKWITQIMRYKTAGYTIEKPLIMGAALGGASDKTIRSLSGYGINLGLAFQIQDDILGMFGNEKTVGKPTDSDLKEGKKTLLVWKTIEELTLNNRQTDLIKFRSFLGNLKLTKKDYLWCQNLMRETGAVDYCEQKVKTLTIKAKTFLQKAKINSEGRRYLLGIADYLVDRSY